MIKWGLKSLNWLLDKQISPEGHLTIIGNDGWLKRNGSRANFDQQPVEAAALIDACFEAYRLNEDEKYLKKIDLIFNWFLGQNDLGQPLYNFKTEIGRAHV